jgi:hypothetical protein
VAAEGSAPPEPADAGLVEEPHAATIGAITIGTMMRRRAIGPLQSICIVKSKT